MVTDAPRHSPWHRLWPLALVAMAAVAGLQSARCTVAETPMTETPALTPATVRTDLGQIAYAHVAAVVALGPRWSGSIGARQSADYIDRTLRERAKLTPVRDRWTDDRFGVAFDNVVATIPGRSDERIVIACHYDTKKCEGHPDPAHNFTFVGANDSGSGVGLLLALAEELAAQPRDATIQLAFLDGEECLDFKWNDDKALFGSKRFVGQEHDPLGRRGAPIRALILLDMVGDRDLSIDEEEYSDKELRAIFRAAAAACGHQSHFFQHKLPIKDDHLPFVKAGIPAIDLIQWTTIQSRWHTADDTIDYISADSLRIVGEVVLTALPAIETRYLAKRERLQLPQGR